MDSPNWTHQTVETSNQVRVQTNNDQVALDWRFGLPLQFNVTKSSSMALHKPHSIYMDPCVRYRAQLGLTVNGVWSRSLWFSLRFGKGRPLHEGSSAPEFGFCPFRVREFFSWTKADERPKLALPVRDPARGSGTDKERQGWPPQKGSQNSEPAQRHGRAVALGEEFPLSFRSIHAVGQGGRLF